MDPTRYKSFKKVLLFYSGGLDTSFLLKWFVEEVGSEVITASFDLGGDAIEVGTIEKRAKQLGWSITFRSKLVSATFSAAFRWHQGARRAAPWTT